MQSRIFSEVSVVNKNVATKGPEIFVFFFLTLLFVGTFEIQYMHCSKVTWLV